MNNKNTSGASAIDHSANEVYKRGETQDRSPKYQLNLFIAYNEMKQAKLRNLLLFRNPFLIDLARKRLQQSFPYVVLKPRLPSITVEHFTAEGN